MKKPAAKKSAAKKTATKTGVTRSRADAQLRAKKHATPKSVAKKISPKKPSARADFGAPIDSFFGRQPAPLRPILEKLRSLVAEAAPDAASSIKWGMPFYTVGGNMMCALGSHKSHVNLILSGPPGSFIDPDERLSGDGKTGRHLKLTSLEDLPLASVRSWLRTAAELARKGR